MRKGTEVRAKKMSVWRKEERRRYEIEEREREKKGKGAMLIERASAIIVERRNAW